MTTSVLIVNRGPAAVEVVEFDHSIPVDGVTTRHDVKTTTLQPTVYKEVTVWGNRSFEVREVK